MSCKSFSYSHRHRRTTQIKNAEDAGICIPKDDLGGCHGLPQDMLDEWCRMLKIGEINADELDMLLDEVIERLR